MTSGVRTAVLASSLTGLLLTPVAAEAQRHYAVPRTRTTVAAGVGPRYYAPYYRPYYYYDPFFYGPSFAIGFGFGYGYPFYPYYPYGGYPYSYYGPYGYYGPGYYDGSASLRLQVMPRETQVYVDGYYAGIVDSFDGTFQRLHLQPGEHEVQLYLPGHRSFSQKLYFQPVNTMRVRHTMEPLRQGDPEPVKPSAQTPPPGSASQRPAGPAPRRLPPPDRGTRDQDRDRAATVPSEFGTVSLRVQPNDAEITIDGQRWAGPPENDQLIVQLGVGMHNIQIRKDGYRTYMTDVTVRRGETTPLNVALTKQ